MGARVEIKVRRRGSKRRRVRRRAETQPTHPETAQVIFLSSCARHIPCSAEGKHVSSDG